jgi:hypothetical protein
MAKQTINIGQTANDRTGDPLRTAFEKINDNFTELYATIPGPYESDEAANTAGVAIGRPYYRSTGQVFVRLA